MNQLLDRGRMFVMWSYIAKRSRMFYTDFLATAGVVTVFALFLAVKITVNLMYGAPLVVGLRSGFLGIMLYAAGCYAIAICAVEKEGVLESRLLVPPRTRKTSLIAALAVTGLIALVITDSAFRTYCSGSLLSSSVYDRFLAWMSRSIAVPVVIRFGPVQPYQIRNILLYLPLYVLLPAVVFTVIGWRFRAAFSWRNTRASWPLLGLTLMMFLANGLGRRSLWNVTYSVLYVGFGEEFFHRGIWTRLTGAFVRKEGNIAVVGTLAFAALHLPGLLFRYAQSPSLAVSEFASLMLYGAMLAYGYRKTGTLLPWIIVHALEDARMLPF